ASTQSENDVDASKHSASAEPVEATLSNSCSTMDTSEEQDLLTREAAHALFSGAPKFSLNNVAGRLSPTVAYPWDNEIKHHD
nr:hypothetical protein [Tanacetum cinerariifolium]